MAKCRRCGKEVSPSRGICYTCMKKWKDIRMRTYNQVKNELGEMSQLNLEEFKKRIKKLELKFKREEEAGK